jgi:hypothetical protein
VDLSRLSRGELIAGASGLVLLVALFLPWYGVDVNVAGFSASESGSAWEVFSGIDIVLFLVALVAVGAPIARQAGVLPDDLPVGLIVTAAGALALLLVLFRIVDVPGPDVPDIVGDAVDYGRRFGLFVGLVAAAGIAYGGYSSMTEEAGPAHESPAG